MQSDNYLLPDVHTSYVDATEHRQSRISTRPASPPNQVRLSVTATTVTVTATFTVAVHVTGTGIGIRIGIGITLSGVNGRWVSSRMGTHSPAIPDLHPHSNENEYEHERGRGREHEHEYKPVFATSSEAPSGHTENVHVHTHTLIHTPVSDLHSRVPSVQYTTGRVGVDA